EILLREGGVAVSYSGCELRVVEGCRVTGRYAWNRTTPATDEFEMRSADDLYARLPLGAVSLQGTLAQAGRLTMRTTVAGQYRLVDAGPLSGPGCASATHVVTGMSVGAFQLSSGDQIAASAGVATPVAGAGLGTEREESLVRRAGDMSRCTAATDAGADPQCQSPIQLFLAPIPAPQAAAPPHV